MAAVRPGRAEVWCCSDSQLNNSWTGLITQGPGASRQQKQCATAWSFPGHWVSVNVHRVSILRKCGVGWQKALQAQEVHLRASLGAAVFRTTTHNQPIPLGVQARVISRGKENVASHSVLFVGGRDRDSLKWPGLSLNNRQLGYRGRVLVPPGFATGRSTHGSEMTEVSEVSSTCAVAGARTGEPSPSIIAVSVGDTA